MKISLSKNNLTEQLFSLLANIDDDRVSSMLTPTHVNLAEQFPRIGQESCLILRA